MYYLMRKMSQTKQKTTDTLIKITIEARNALRRYKNAQAAVKDQPFTYTDAILDLIEKANK